MWNTGLTPLSPEINWQLFSIKIAKLLIPILRQMSELTVLGKMQSHRSSLVVINVWVYEWTYSIGKMRLYYSLECINKTDHWEFYGCCFCIVSTCDLYISIKIFSIRPFKMSVKVLTIFTSAWKSMKVASPGSYLFLSHISSTDFVESGTLFWLYKSGSIHPKSDSAVDNFSGRNSTDAASLITCSLVLPLCSAVHRHPHLTPPSTYALSTSWTLHVVWVWWRKEQGEKARSQITMLQCLKCRIWFPYRIPSVWTFWTKQRSSAFPALFK